MIDVDKLIIISKRINDTINELNIDKDINNLTISANINNNELIALDKKLYSLNNDNNETYRPCDNLNLKLNNIDFKLYKK